MSSKWTRETICCWIRNEYKSKGVVRRAEDSGLRNAVARHYGGWPAAFTDAGVPVHRLPRITKERLLERLRQLATNGRICTSLLRGLHSAASHYYGSIENACMQAEITIDAPSPRWTKESVKEELKKYAKQLASHNIPAVPKRNPGLTRATRTKFGSWIEACKAAGVPRLIGKNGEVAGNFGRIHYKGKYYTKQAGKSYISEQIDSWDGPSPENIDQLAHFGAKLYGSKTEAKRVIRQLRRDIYGA